MTGTELEKSSYHSWGFANSRAVSIAQEIFKIDSRLGVDVPKEEIDPLPNGLDVRLSGLFLQASP